VQQDRREDAADLERALRAALDGLEIRDEGILLDGAPSAGRAGEQPRRAVLAGVIDGGRAVLVTRPSREDGPVELAAIDALAWTEEYGDALAQRLGADRDQDVLVVLVVDPPDAGLRASLRTLRADRLLVLVERRLRSARGEDVRLTPLDLGGRSATSAPEGIEGFLARLGAPVRGWAEAAARGVSRIDPELREHVAGTALIWRDADGVRCALRVHGADIVGEADGVGGPITGPDEVERFLERAVRTYRGPERPEAPARLQRPEDPPRALLPQGPLLSEDELAALRGDA